MGKFFLILIAIILAFVFGIVALLGLLRRFLLGFVPRQSGSKAKDTSIIYDDGTTIVHSIQSHARSSKRTK